MCGVADQDNKKRIGNWINNIPQVLQPTHTFTKKLLMTTVMMVSGTSYLYMSQRRCGAGGTDLIGGNNSIGEMMRTLCRGRSDSFSAVLRRSGASGVNTVMGHELRGVTGAARSFIGEAVKI